MLYICRCDGCNGCNNCTISQKYVNHPLTILYIKHILTNNIHPDCISKILEFVNCNITDYLNDYILDVFSKHSVGQILIYSDIQIIHLNIESKKKLYFSTVEFMKNGFCINEVYWFTALCKLNDTISPPQMTIGNMMSANMHINLEMHHRLILAE